jgi:methylmalonyl-CoA mutase N-terminal domain/subunit
VASALAGYVPSAEPPYDEPLGLGWSVEAQQLAEDAARIIQYESKLTEVTDPLAGSYYIEAMTDRIEKEAWQIIEEIDRMGGAVAAIERGYMQRAIARTAYEYQKRLENMDEIVVGVNAFIDENELEVLPNRVVPYPYDSVKRAKAEGRQLRKLTRIKKQRNNAQVKKLLSQLHKAACDDKVNLMPYIIDAVKAYSTIGEICGVLREVFGEYSAYGTI